MTTKLFDVSILFAVAKSKCDVMSLFHKWPCSQIGSTVVKAFAFQADGLGFNSPSGYKVGGPGHSKYVWVGQYEPSCLKVPFLSP